MEGEGLERWEEGGGWSVCVGRILVGREGGEKVEGCDEGVFLN